MDLRPPRLFLLLGALLWAGAASAAEKPASDPRVVTIAPSRTSIYVGVVTLATDPLLRRNGAFACAYTATVFPYFFWSERGRLSIPITDDSIERLMRGESLDFTGTAVCDSGETRRIEGRAIPDSPGAGRLKVRVYVTRTIVLIFNTTYTLSDTR